MHAGGTWPLVSAIFLVVIAVLLIWGYLQHSVNKSGAEPHFHKDAGGIWHACYHACKQQNLFFSKMYWISLTLAFPVEHIVYHKLWPFYLLSNWLNIS